MIRWLDTNQIRMLDNVRIYQVRMIRYHQIQNDTDTENICKIRQVTCPSRFPQRSHPCCDERRHRTHRTWRGGRIEATPWSYGDLNGNHRKKYIETPKPQKPEFWIKKMMRWKFMISWISWFMLGKCASLVIYRVFLGSRWRGKIGGCSCWHLMGAESLKEHQNTHGVAGQQQTQHLGRPRNPGDPSHPSGCITNWNHWLNSGNGWKWMEMDHILEIYGKMLHDWSVPKFFIVTSSDVLVIGELPRIRQSRTYPSSLAKMLTVGETIHLCWWNDPTCDACL